MSVLTVVLYTIVVLVALLLIGLILIQQSKGGGFGSAFGGAGEAVFGAQAGNHMTKLTVILTSAFFLLTLALAVIIGHRGKESGAVDRVDKDLDKAPALEQKAELPVALPAKTEAVKADVVKADKVTKKVVTPDADTVKIPVKK
jgi:preprotein translocase subunit SecG